MAVNDLDFTRNALNRWVSKFSSQGSPVTVQIQRAGTQKLAVYLVVYANLPGMEPAPVYTASGNPANGLIFEVDVAEGVEVTIESNVEVLQAKIMG